MSGNYSSVSPMGSGLGEGAKHSLAGTTQAQFAIARGAAFYSFASSGCAEGCKFGALSTAPAALQGAVQ